MVYYKFMALGEIFTAPVERIVAGGAGMARVRGKSVFINLTAPGDIVTGRIRRENRDFARADLLEIREPSPERILPPCPLYGACGGCSLQHLPYEVQVREKTALLEDAFRRIGGFASLPAIEVRRSAPYEYRNRMQFHRLRQTPGEPRAPSRRRLSPGAGREARPGSLLGLMARRSGEIIPAADCPVADPRIRRALSGGGIPPPPEKDRFTVYARGTMLLYEGGPERGTVQFLGRELRMDAGLFFQSNGGALEALIADLLGLAQGADRKLPAADIYCGVGTFASFLQDLFPRIDLVEENRAALGLARENLSGANCRFFPLPCDRWVRKAAGPYGFMVADPPRQGFSPALRSYLAERGPPVLAYISCDPATLARDSRDLCRGGYALEKLYFHDFYPQTTHIEILAVFLRGSHP
jgi:23S rRNA (uracil1939-C5)-methyltransferase